MPGAPVLDPGTFAIARNGVSGHPVAWGWRKPAGGPASQIEHFALYKVGDSADGFLRPNYASSGLGYMFTWIPDPQNQPLDHVSFNAWKQWVQQQAVQAQMIVKALTFVQADAADTTGPGDAPAFLGPGLHRVRATAIVTDPVIALALRGTSTFREHWRLSLDSASRYLMPGQLNPNVPMHFWGAPEIDLDELPAVENAVFTLPPTAASYFTKVDP